MAFSSFSTTLEDTARRICETRDGKWSGTKGMARCPAHDDRTPSLGVTVGQRAILFHCFAGCDRSAVLAAFASDGVDPRMLFSGSPGATPDLAMAPKPSAAALRLWRYASPLKRTPAKAYLESRSILAGSSAICFHPRTPLGPMGRTRFLPALIASVSVDEGPIAVHRTFLAPDGAAKAAFAKPKRALGPLGEGAVRLLPPIQGKLGLAEGLESAMSAYALTGIPTWATLGNERFGLVAIPESVTELHLFIDHDAGGALAAERGLVAYGHPNRVIHVRKPARRGADWNDELQAWLRRKAPS